jgi:ribose 1,5-bisphosphokinase
MPSAPIVYVMGPSGAGKDSVLRYARERLDGQAIVFAHRYITRLPVPGDENHIALRPAEFIARRSRKLFAMHWEAHGLHYGIGIEVDAWREAGFVVVVSGSRAHFEERLAVFPDVIPVLVTCDMATLARRLAARGREDARKVQERVERAATLPIAHPALVTIDNSGPIDVAGERLLEILIAAARRMP